MTPRAAPAWTDRDTHDPGVTLLEALTYGLADLAASAGARARAIRCGWRCALVVGATVVGGVALARRARTGAATHASDPR